MNEIKEIRELLESISCHCAEGVEFLDKLQLAEKVQRRTLVAIAICDELLETQKKARAFKYTNASADEFVAAAKKVME